MRVLVLADENFTGPILRGLLERLPELDVIRAQDTEMYQADDVQLLEWAAQENRVLLTHDFDTMIGYVYDRVRAGLTCRASYQYGVMNEWAISLMS